MENYMCDTERNFTLLNQLQRQLKIDTLSVTMGIMRDIFSGKQSFTTKSRIIDLELTVKKIKDLHQNIEPC